MQAFEPKKSGVAAGAMTVNSPPRQRTQAILQHSPYNPLRMSPSRFARREGDSTGPMYALPVSNHPLISFIRGETQFSVPCPA
jgi:hypothetical protein